MILINSSDFGVSTREGDGARAAWEMKGRGGARTYKSPYRCSSGTWNLSPQCPSNSGETSHNATRRYICGASMIFGSYLSVSLIAIEASVSLIISTA
jgi:hypothetical protein